MKGISIRQPWAALVATGAKDMENRGRRTGYRGRVLIHASKTVDGDTMALLSDMLLDSPHSWIFEARGAIIGVATIVDCVTESESDWFEGPYGYLMADAIPFTAAIPARGQLGLFDVPVTTQIAAKLFGKQPDTIRAAARRLNIGQRIGRDYIFSDHDLHLIESSPGPGRPA